METERKNNIITFVVPAFNAEATLNRTINSILNQTDSNWKVIIINDGSSDQTEKISKKYVLSNPQKITYVWQENQGLGGARNTGLSKVESEYVSFLDSDDWLMPDYVEKIRKGLQETSQNVEMIMTLPKIYHEENKSVIKWYDHDKFLKVFPKDGTVIDLGQNDVQEEIYQFEVNQCRKVLSMEFVHRIHFQFEPKIKWEDVYPHFYLLSTCRKCMGVQVGFYYRVGSSSQITASHGADRLDFLIVMRSLLGLLEKQNNKKMIFPIMRVIVRFSIWCIRMADMDTRKIMVRELHKTYKKIPQAYFSNLRSVARKKYSIVDALQYDMFVLAIRCKIFNFVFEDYLWQDVCEKILKKMLHAKNRVA